MAPCRYRFDPMRRISRTPVPPPSPEELEALEELTDRLPEPLRAFRDLGLLSPRRRYRLERAIDRRTRSFCLVLHGVRDPHNLAAVLRTSEALGLQEVHVVRRSDAPFRPSDRVTQNAHKWLDLSLHPSFPRAAEALRSRGFSLWAAAIAETARPLWEVDFTGACAVVLGNEAHGLPPRVRAACDGCLEIPLGGLTTSLNVSVAAAIVAWTGVEQRRRRWPRVGDLDEGERMRLRARFYALAASELPASLRASLAALEAAGS